jgi:hypothetical protein
MSTLLTRLPENFSPPNVRIFSGRSDSFFLVGTEWHRADAEDEAKAFSGYDRETHEPNVGIYIVRRPNSLLRIGFDIWKLNANLRPEAIERIETRWRREAVGLSKSMLRSAQRRSHFSKSFARFEISPERLEAWKSELESILSNPASFEPLERRPVTDNVNP